MSAMCGFDIVWRRQGNPMTKFSITLALIAVAGAGVHAQEIYKWTDSEGNVHYEDRPSELTGAASQLVAVRSQRTNAAAVQAGVEARLERQEARAEAREEALEAEKAAEEERAAEAQKVEQCAEYRQRLERMITSRRLYKLDESGERVYLDDAQMDEARSQLQARIMENCSG